MTQSTTTKDALEGYFTKLAGSDDRVGISFVTYFPSKEVVLRAFADLSFASVVDGRVDLPDGISSQAQIITDKNRIALVFLVGRFSRSQAEEVVRVFSRHVDRAANEAHLAETAADYGRALEDAGKGQLVWIDWGEGGQPKGRRWRFWK